MFALNLPEYTYKIKHSGEKIYIFDPLRHKYLILTPEEWVRQHLVNYLVQYLGYPKSLISLERGLNYHGRSKRSDILIFDPYGQPFMIIECKAPYVSLNAQVLEQASAYNQVHQAPYLVVSNGMETLCFQVSWANNKVEYCSSIPAYSAENT